jgi:nucleoside-diphosphate-sugar epimerase
VPGALSGKTVAITGAAGFLGARTAARLAGADCTIIRVARSPQRPIDHAVAAVLDVTGDLSERSVWDRVVEADVVFHFAAQTSVAAADADPDADFRANVMPLRHLVAACRDRQRRPIVLLAGTVTEAGVPRRWPVNEDVPDAPITVYDRHKLIAENDLKTAAAEGTLRGATLRLANVYGPGAHGRRADRDVLNRMIGAAVIGQPLTIYGTGQHLRDYVFVEDVVDAFLAAAGHIERVNARHFVIGSGTGISIREAFELIAARVEARTGRRVPVITAEPPAPLSPIDERNFVADPSRFAAATGWRASRSLSDGIDRTIEALTCA